MLGSSFRFIYLFILLKGNVKKKTSPRLKPSFIYLLFCFICLCYYLFIVFFLMYKRVMKCIMVGANRKDRFDLFACSGSLRSWRFVWREGKWTVQISEAVSASCSSLLRFSFARLRNKTASPATQAIAVAVTESTMTFVHCNITVTYRHFQITLRKSYLRLSWFAVLYNWSLSKPLTM